MLKQVPGRCGSQGNHTEAAVPEGLYTVESTHPGPVFEELGRTDVEQGCE